MANVAGWKIALDAGHGGGDPGAVGPTDLYEKDVNLEIAEKVKAMLEEFDVIVNMIRTDDTDINVDDRVEEANNWGADLMISIHQNSSSSTATHCCVAHCHDSNSKNDELAKTIEGQMESILDTYGQKASHQVQDCGLAITDGPNMPSGITEGCFISNPDFEALLKTDEYKTDQAKGIRNGILVYIANQ